MMISDHERAARAHYLELTRQYDEALRIQPERGTEILLLAARVKLAGREWVRAEREANATPQRVGRSSGP